MCFLCLLSFGYSGLCGWCWRRTKRSLSSQLRCGRLEELPCRWVGLLRFAYFRCRQQDGEILSGVGISFSLVAKQPEAFTWTKGTHTDALLGVTPVNTGLCWLINKSQQLTGKSACVCAHVCRRGFQKSHCFKGLDSSAYPLPLWMILMCSRTQRCSSSFGCRRLTPFFFSVTTGGVMGRRINTKQEEGSNETWSFEMETRRSSPTDFGFSAACLTRFAQNRVNDDRMRQSLLFTVCVCVCVRAGRKAQTWEKELRQRGCACGGVWKSACAH